MRRVFSIASVMLFFLLSPPSVSANENAEHYLVELEKRVQSYSDALSNQDPLRITLERGRIGQLIFSQPDIDLYIRGLTHLNGFFRNTDPDTAEGMKELAQYLQKRWELKYAQELQALQNTHPEVKERRAKLGALIGGSITGSWMVLERGSTFLSKESIGPYFRLFRYLYPVRILFPIAGAWLGATSSSSKTFSEVRIPPSPAHLIAMSESKSSSELPGLSALNGLHSLPNHPDLNDADESEYLPDEDLKKIYQQVTTISALTLGWIEARALRPGLIRGLSQGMGSVTKGIARRNSNLILLGASLAIYALSDEMVGTAFDLHRLGKARREFIQSLHDFIEEEASLSKHSLYTYYESGERLAKSALYYSSLLNLIESRLSPISFDQLQLSPHTQANWREMMIIRDSLDGPRGRFSALRREQKKEDRILADLLRQGEISNQPSWLIRQTLGILRTSSQADLFQVWNQKLISALSLNLLRSEVYP